MKKLFVLLSFVVLLPGCGGISQAYLRADQATFDAVSPEYLKYVEADQSLDQEKKDRRKRTVETWKLRIEKGE